MSLPLASLFSLTLSSRFIIHTSDNSDQVKYRISIHQNYPEEKTTIQSHQLN